MGVDPGLSLCNWPPVARLLPSPTLSHTRHGQVFPLSWLRRLGGGKRFPGLSCLVASPAGRSPRIKPAFSFTTDAIAIIASLLLLICIHASHPLLMTRKGGPLTPKSCDSFGLVSAPGSGSFCTLPCLRPFLVAVVNIPPRLPPSQFERSVISPLSRDDPPLSSPFSSCISMQRPNHSFQEQHQSRPGPE